MVITSASDIIRLRRLFVYYHYLKVLLATSFSNSLQKSSAIQKISITLSLLIISNEH